MAPPVSKLEVKNHVAVASKDLAAGEVILHEAALVSGPGRAGIPLCISCYSIVDGEYYCTECSWQCCGEECEQREVHKEECRVYKEKEIYASWEDVGTQTLSMDFMGAYRLLLAMKNEPKLTDLLKLNLNNNLRKERFNIKYYVGCEDVITKYILEKCGLCGFSEEEILTALGLFELLGTPLHNGAKAFHPSTVHMKHSCMPNCYIAVEADQSISVRASVNIAKGEPVTRSLVDVMKCNLFRRRELEKAFFINCDCKRCKDGSEMGTNYGGLIVQEFNNHIFVPSNPRDENSTWVSSNVPGAELSGAECCNQLNFLSKRCDEGIEEVGGNAGTIEFILSNPGEWDVLPRTGQVMMDVKKGLIAAYGSSYGSTYDVLDNQKIKNKVEICWNMLELLGKFHPGRNYNAAMLHYGLVTKGDKSLAGEGVKHCEAAEEICEGQEEGSMYNQLKMYVLGIKEAMKA